MDDVLSLMFILVTLHSQWPAMVLESHQSCITGRRLSVVSKIYIMTNVMDSNITDCF